MKKAIILLTGIIFLMACERSIDTSALESILLDTDREFSKLSVEKGNSEAFLNFMADDAVVLPREGHPIEGKETYTQLIAKDQEVQQGRELKWEPYFADISSSGDLGYTLGKYVRTIENSSGEKQITYGYYVTIWKIQSDGSWKFVFDTGNESPGPDKD
jgi:ketosteroid isomerase-like protein